MPVWCKYFETLEPTKLTKPDNINQFIVTFGLFPRITSEPAPFEGYDLTTPFLTSRLAFAVPRASSVLPARDTLSYSKAKHLMRSNANEFEWTFFQDGLLDKNLKNDVSFLHALLSRRSVFLLKFMPCLYSCTVCSPNPNCQPSTSKPNDRRSTISTTKFSASTRPTSKARTRFR